VVESLALGCVTLSQVVGEAPDMARVPGNKGFEGAAGADRAKLPVIAYGNQFRSRGLHCRQQFADVGVRGHRAFVQDQDVAWAEHFVAVLDAPSEGRHSTGGNTGAFPESLGCLARSCRTKDLVAGSFETFPHGRNGARFARAGHSDHKVQRVPGTEQTLGDFGLSPRETEPSGKLCPADGCSCLLVADSRPGTFRKAVSEVRDPALVFDDTRCRPNRLPSLGNERQ
jgi:hypothetical protein